MEVNNNKSNQTQARCKRCFRRTRNIELKTQQGQQYWLCECGKANFI